MTREEAITDIKDNIKPVVGGKSLDVAIKALEQEPCEMTVEEYRQRMIQAFHNADCDELIAVCVLPTEKEFKHLEWLLKNHYKKEPCEDCVSRQAVEEMIKAEMPERGMWEIDGDKEKETVCEVCVDLMQKLSELQPVMAKPCDDAISRQIISDYVESHIQEINTGYGDLNKHTNEILRMIVDYIEKLEPVTPQPNNVLDKIRAEIVDLGQRTMNDNRASGIWACRDIIDKYKAESEKV